MLSIKVKIKHEIEIDDYLRQFNNVVRVSYNRFVDGLSLSQIYHLCNKSLKNIDLLDASFVEGAVLKAQWIFKTQGKKVIFGGKQNFLSKKYKKKDKREFNKNKWLTSIGRKSFKGNRKFNFNLENNKIVFKPEKKVKIPIEFHPPKGFQHKLLLKAGIMANSKELPITINLSKDYIIFQIDETILQEPAQKSIKNRVLAIDSNPNFIAVSVSDFDSNDKQTVIYKELLNLKELNKCKNTNKRTYEIYKIAKHIAKLAKHYHCEIVGIEELIIPSKDHKKGKQYNKSINNNWNRTAFFNCLKKWLNIYSIKFQEIASQYSSFIGQLTNENEVDSIAASLEIARRAYLFNRIFLKRDKTPCSIIYPDLKSVSLPTRWKKMVTVKAWQTWKPLYEHIKKSKLSYRFLFDDWVKTNNRSSSRFQSRKSNVFLYYN